MPLGTVAAIRHHSAAAAAFAALAVLLTWPLAGHLTTHAPGSGYGDNLTFLWSFWWMRQALASATESAFFSAWLFAPTGVDLTAHTHFAVGTFVGATVLRGLSIAAAQNLVVMLSVALNGFAAYLLAWRTARDRSGALVAGLFFAASPYFTGRLLGHFNLLAAWGLPAFWLCFASALGRRSWPWAIAAGAVAVITAYTDYYYAVYVGVLAVCLLAARWVRLEVSRSRPPRTRTPIDIALLIVAGALMTVAVVVAATGGGVATALGQRISITSGFNLRTAAWVSLLIWGWRRWRPAVRISGAPAADIAGDLRRAAAVVAVSIVGTLPLATHAWHLWQRGDYVSQTYFWRSAPGGIDVATLAIGAPWHSVWGGVVQRLYALAHIDAMESVAWFGVVPLFFLWTTRAVWWRGPDPAATRVVALVFFLWALGPLLVVFGWNTGLYLPEVLLRYIPIVANARIPGRAIVMVYLAMALWLAVAVASRPAGRRSILSLLLGAATLAEFIAVPLPLVPLDAPPIYAHLETLPAGAVIELPLGLRDGFGEQGALDHRTLYYQSIHGKPQAGGFVARLPASVTAVYRQSPWLSALLDLSDEITVPGDALAGARESGAAFCRSRGFRYVVLNTGTASPALQDFVRSLPWLKRELTDGGRELYVVQ